MNNGKESEILKIIETLTTTGKKNLDESQVKKLKTICKSSDNYVNFTYYALMTELRKDHSDVRYSALLIINELFCRSTCFRQLLERQIDEFLELVVETNLENPLPEPMPRAKDLKIKGLEFIKSWASKFGEAHKRMQLAIHYLKKCKKVDFNNMERRVSQREQHHREQERRERILDEKVHQIRAEIKESSDEMSKTLVQMENCFRLLIPHPTDELFSCQDFENSESLSLLSENEDSKLSSFIQDNLVPEDSLRQHGIYNVQNVITIEIKDISEVDVKTNGDTIPVIENLNDLYKEITNRYLPRITYWLKILTKGRHYTDALKEVIDMKQMVESVLKKYGDLKIKPNIPNLDDDEEDDFIEVKEKEGYEAEACDNGYINISQSRPSCSKDLSAVEKASLGKFQYSEYDIKDSISTVSTVSKRISESDVPLLNRFDSSQILGKTKNDNKENRTLKETRMASLQMRKIEFSGKFDCAKWSCRAPLPSGKLCPRKDRFKCPFHGKIIQRNSMGDPVDAQDVAGPIAEGPTVPDWQDPELLRSIEAATGINLKMPPKKSKRKSTKVKNRLTNIKIKKTTARERISKKILKGYKH